MSGVKFTMSVANDPESKQPPYSLFLCCSVGHTHNAKLLIKEFGDDVRRRTRVFRFRLAENECMFFCCVFLSFSQVSVLADEKSKVTVRCLYHVKT